MNRPLRPGISDRSATGPAGRSGAAVVDVSGAGLVVVVGPDFPLLPLEQAETSTASTVHATHAADGTVLRCISIGLPSARGQGWQKVTDEGRATKLASTGGLSPQELERATTALHVQEQVVNAAHESLRAAEADVQRAEAGELAVRAARGGVAASQARLQGARADSVAASMRLGYTELRAPASGVVQVLAARRGELVGPGTPVAVIVVPDQLWVRVAAPESDAGAVAVGDSLEVRFPSGEKVRGKVISKSAEGEFATQHDVSASKRDIRAVAFRVAIANPKRTIVPGITASVVLPTVRP